MTADSARGLWVSFRGAVEAARRDLMDGAVARALAVVALYPLDAAKARLQVTSAASRVAAAAAVRGPLAPPAYAGVAAAVAGQLPYGALTFGAFEAARAALEDAHPAMPPGRRVVLAACLADLVGALWLAPAELLKLKVQAGVYSSVPRAFTGTLRAVGPIGLFHGFAAQAARDMPFRALQIAAYARAREAYLARARRSGRSRAPPGMSRSETVAVGALVGATVGAITTPLDVVKTRIMSQRAGAGQLYTSWIECLSRSVQAEGPGTLFRGVVPRVAYMAASVAIFSLGYEASKTYIADRKLLWHADVAKATSAADDNAERVSPGRR